MNKVKIRLLRTTGMGHDGVGVPGQVFEVTQALAQELVGNGRAEHVKGKIYESTPDEPEEKKEEPKEEPKIEAAAVEPPKTATAEPQRSGPQRRKP